MIIDLINNGGGGGGDLSNYYTKTEIDNKGFMDETQEETIAKALVEHEDEIDDHEERITTVEDSLQSFAHKDNFVTLTQDEYDALTTKNPDTYYFIKED